MSSESSVQQSPRLKGKGYAPVLTIDGPSGSGKGTVSVLLAKQFNWHMLDSGAIYRVLALAAVKEGIDLDVPDKLEQLALNLNLHFKSPDTTKLPRVFLDDTDISETVRTEETGALASKISAFPEVRRGLLARQRAFRQDPGLVTDGRDMGTVVFPDAFLKVFLVASVEERAARRAKQLQEIGINVNLARLQEEIAQRDYRDQNRPISPLKPAQDAIIVDTTQKSIAEVFAQILHLAEERM